MTGNDPKNKQREVLTKRAFRDDGARMLRSVLRKLLLNTRSLEHNPNLPSPGIAQE